MSVLSDFREAIAIHQRKDDESYDEQINLPVEERVAKGITMNNLVVEFDFYDSAPNPWCPRLIHPQKFIRFAKIHSQNNISKFGEGAQVVLSNGSAVFKMEVVEDTVDSFIIAPNEYEVKHCYLDSEGYNKNNWEINILKSDLTLSLLSATAGNLENDPVRLTKIEQLLAGKLENEKSPTFRYHNLNDSQNRAIEQAIESSNFHIIQGPPGTGKTETIAHIARILIDQGKKVFITAPTHTAINNCLNAISNKISDATKVVKIGEKYQASEILGNRFITRKTRLPLDAYKFNQDLSKNGIIIGGTPYCFCYPASKRLNNWEFDIALIDEAAQMSIPMAVSVMSKTDKFIFVGDHKQLDPIIPVGTDSSMFTESIFRRLVTLYSSQVTLLDISYRLNDQLIRIPNALFYDNQLRSDASSKRLNVKIESEKFPEVLNNKDPKVLYLHQEFDSQGRSPHEASIVAELVNDLLKSGIGYEDIGVVTPYRAQVREIKKALNRVIGGIDTTKTEALFIDTVDRMQGQERDFIIYSMSNSHPLESKRRLDFFYSPNRLNVAITRAKQRCIVIANYKVFDIIDEELSEMADYANLKPSLDVFKSYYQLSTKITESKGQDEW